MNRLTCMIVDDEAEALQVLQTLARQSGLLEIALATTQPLEALTFVGQHSVHLALLDIHMPGITGLEMAKALQGRCKVIFTTGHAGHVTDAFDLEVVDYLLKPIALTRFISAIQRAMAAINPKGVPAFANYSIEHDYLLVKTDLKGKRQKINVADIDYVQSKDNYLEIYHNGRPTMVLQTLKSLEERLPPQYFLRIHKSYLVAIRKISAIEGSSIELRHLGLHLPVGDTYKKLLQQIMDEKTL